VNVSNYAACERVAFAVGVEERAHRGAWLTRAVAMRVRARSRDGG